MSFEPAGGRNLVVSNNDNRVLCLGNIGLIANPWKFDVFNAGIFALEASLPGGYLFY